MVQGVTAFAALSITGYSFYRLFFGSKRGWHSGRPGYSSSEEVENSDREEARLYKEANKAKSKRSGGIATQGRRNNRHQGSSPIENSTDNCGTPKKKSRSRGTRRNGAQKTTAAMSADDRLAQGLVSDVSDDIINLDNVDQLILKGQWKKMQKKEN